MMFKVASFFVFLIIFISFVSAQWVETPIFVEVTSQQAGSLAQGCAVANMAGMLASLNNSKIGTSPEQIIKELCKKLDSPDRWPVFNYDLLSAALDFLVRVL